MGWSIQELNERLSSNELLQDAEVTRWVQQSDCTNAGQFYAGDQNAAYQAVQQASRTIVEKYLNNPSPESVPLRLRTKFCVILNNFALHKPVRQAVFNCLEGLTQTFEKAIAEEGSMEFDQELGRMSEHVLVLLMRVMNYKLKASAVHEFAEGNVQFSIQLLLAILLKEPPYENELRYNCIRGLLGFTQPQAFFSGDQQTIKELDCKLFTEKVTFMMELMLRLQALQVISEVLADSMLDVDDPRVCAAMTDTMKMLMNIFKFAQSGNEFTTLQWRQHILLSSTFMDGDVVLFAQGLGATLDGAVRSQAPIPSTLLPTLSLTFKFGAFATYHLGNAATELRVFCTFFHDLLHLPLGPLMKDPTMQKRTMEMYINLLHFMCNVDALVGDDDIPKNELLPELSSHFLRLTLDRFFRGELGGFGLEVVQSWHQSFLRMDTSVMVSYDSVTYQTLDALFTSVEHQLQGKGAAPPAVAPASSKGSLLGDIPNIKNNSSKADKVSIDAAAKLAKKSEKTQGKTTRAIGKDLNTCFCALTGNVMKNPVTSPYGHSFEKEDIMRWLEENGSICPVTGKSLTAAQLTPNTVIASMVMQRVLQESMANQGDDDLYNF